MTFIRLKRLLFQINAVFFKTAIKESWTSISQFPQKYNKNCSLSNCFLKDYVPLTLDVMAAENSALPSHIFFFTYSNMSENSYFKLQ